MNRLLFAMLALALLTPFAPAADKAPQEKPPEVEKPKVEETRKLLAEHQTVAKFKQIQFRRCMGMTSLCPDKCGGSGNFAIFEIVGYVSYTKTGEYGDPKQTSFLIQIDDNMKNLKVTKEIADTAHALQPGDTVVLNWRHDYVTRKEGGGSSSFPERPITKLEKISAEEGDKLLKPAK